MSERKHDIEIEIDAPAGLVWKAVTEGQGITRWFAPEAEVVPGPEGSIRVSWGPGMEGTARPFTVWEEGKRVAWTEDYGGRPKVIELILEGSGGKTKLRLVHSGFSADASFDGEYESTHGGWHMFLAMLRHGLEQHALEPAEPVWKFTMVPVPQPELAPKLAAQFSGPIEEGAPFRLDWPGAALTGTVLRTPRPGYACLAVDQWNGSILGLFVERAGPQSMVTVQAVLFGPARREAAGLPAAIGEFLARLGG